MCAGGRDGRSSRVCHPLPCSTHLRLSPSRVPLLAILPPRLRNWCVTLDDTATSADEQRAVFIYSCPPLSPIKSRLLYSSSTSGITAYAKSLGITLLTKVRSHHLEKSQYSGLTSEQIETSEPEEINAAFVDAEVAHLAPFDVKEDAYRGTAPIPATAAFARPSRPGRKR